MKHPLFDIEVHTPAEFAKLVGVSKPTVANWIQTGRIKAERVVGRWYIPATELMRLKTGAKH